MNRTKFIVPEHEVMFTAIRAQGAGGQNVNKVSSAVQLRYDIRASSLPEDMKAQLLELRDRRITSDGVVVIKAQGSRSQPQNKLEAIARLHALLERAATIPTIRKPTRPTMGARHRRMAEKNMRGDIKRLRTRLSAHDD